MSAYYSEKEQLFVGVAPVGDKESALANALAMAKGFYGTNDVDHEEVSVDHQPDVANEYVGILAFPRSDTLPRTDEQKEVTIISEDPYRHIYIPDGGDIGVPFFTARGASLVLTRQTDGQATLVYVVTIVCLGALRHRFNYPTSVYARLLRSNGQTDVARISLGNMHANCSGTFLLTLRSRSFDGGLFPIIAKASIEFTFPEYFDYC